MKTIYYALLFFAGLLFAGCSDDDKYIPGDPVPDNCMGVYFLVDNESNYMLTPEEMAANPSITLRLSRVLAADAASVPIEVEYKDEGLNVPATVQFAAGQEEADLVIEFPTIEKFKTYKFSVRVADPYADHYAATLDGCDRLTGSIFVTEWETVIQNAYFYLYYETGFNGYEANIEHLKGMNKFRFVNFLNTGSDFLFSLENEEFLLEDRSTWKGEIIPLANALYEEDNSMWYLVDEAGEYVTWNAAQHGADLDGMGFWNATGYNTIDLSQTTGNGYMTAYLYYADGKEGWDYVMYYWEQGNVVNNN